MTLDIYDAFRLKVSRKLTAALKRQDKQTVHALRAALQAVDNASAVELADPVERVSSGPGAASDVIGRTINREIIERILKAEAQARQTASREYEKLGRGDEAHQFETEAEIIKACLKDLDTEDTVVER